MNIQRAFSISGVGKYLPESIILSSSIENELKLPKNWIFKNLGVKKRYRATHETNTYMGSEALKKALIDAELTINDLDYIIGASATFDHVIPNRSSLIKNTFKSADDLDFPCIDINTVCTSFISALDYASLLMNSGDYKNIAIVSSEISSKGLNPNNPETYSLFGDGAASIIVSKTNSSAGLIKYDSKTYSKGAKNTIIEGGGNKNHFKDTAYDPELFSFKMNGRKLLKEAKFILPNFIKIFFSETSIKFSETHLIIPHQASKLGIRMLTSINKGNSENIADYLEDYGNCIAASIPLALVDSIKNKTLKNGDTSFLIGTAAGVTITGLLLKYSKK